MIEFRIIRKIGVKNIYLKINKHGEVIVSGGLLLTKKRAKKLIEEKHDWIVSKLEKIKRVHDEKSQISSAETCIYLGKEYPIIQRIDSTCKAITIDFNGSELVLTSSENVEVEDILFCRDEFYRSEIKKIAPDIIKKMSEVTGFYPTKVTYRKAKTRWGSCSGKNSISLNIFLIAIPPSLMEYVILHELVHIKHKNHSKDFWNCVYQYCSEYKKYDKMLKQYSFLLV